MKPRLPGMDDAQSQDADCAQQLRRAADATRAIAIIVTDKDGGITFWNRGARCMFGYEAHEMAGRPVSVLLEPDEDTSPMEEGAMDAWPGQPVAAVERWYRQKYGGLVFGVGTAISMHPPVGNGWVWFIRDITLVRKQRMFVEQRLVEQEEAVSAARHANAARDRLLAVMSHEIRQPLAELLLHADRLLEPGCRVDAAELHEIGQAMKSAIRRQVRIIDDLLEFSRLRTGKFRLELMPVDISSMVQATCATMARGAPNLQLHVDTQFAGESRCMADPVRLEQILSNLLGNAVKFSQDGGRIDVQLALDGDDARISVADTGCGIEAEFLPHVFSMFEQEHRQTAPANAGLGIGLALVHELVTAHGGRVQACSDGPGRGARFTVWLPLAGNATRSRSRTSGDIAAVPAAVTRALSPRGIDVPQSTR